MIAPAGAGASTVVGSNLAQPPSESICVLGPGESCSLGVAAVPFGNQAPGGVTVPGNGVIVNWRISSLATFGEAPLPVKLRVLDGTTAVASGPLQTLPGQAGIHEFAVRVPVKAGVSIGVDFPTEPEFTGIRVVAGATAAITDFWEPVLLDGQIRSPSESRGNTELLMNATVEPDLDGDGWGDETQDRCGGVAGPEAGCPRQTVIVDPAPPAGTRIESGPRGRTDSRTATFRFSAIGVASGFQCMLDRRVWSPCKSPKTYRGLAVGRHVFRVRAVSPSGAVDLTPAKHRFRVDL
jgi:hypothetical protein